MPEKIFGLPAWAVILTLGGAGVVGYLIFFRNSTPSSGSSTAQANTSYSPQGLAVMANPDYSGSIAAMNQELFSGFNTVQQSLEGINTNVMGGTTGIESGIAGLQGNQADISNLLQQLNTYTSSLGGLINTDASNLSGQVTSNQNANNSYYLSLLQALQNYTNSLQTLAGGSGSGTSGVSTGGGALPPTPTGAPIGAGGGGSGGSGNRYDPTTGIFTTAAPGQAQAGG
jgi:hypothetical protein